MLVDTVYSGEQREVHLTDLNGGFYFDSASRDQAFGEYGFSFRERRFLADWRIVDGEGDRIDSLLSYCIVRPDRIERYFRSGVIEKVECPVFRTGLLLTIRPGGKKGVACRPLFDFRRLDREEAPHYKTETSGERTLLTVHRSDNAGGWLAIAAGDGIEMFSAEERLRIDHPQGDLTGRSGVSFAYIAGDFFLKSHQSGRIAFGWGETSEEAVQTALEILEEVDIWRTERHVWMTEILDGLRFTCDNIPFVKAFAWARLSLAGMIFEREGEEFLITGIPYSPYPNGWYTALSVEGIAVSEGSPATALALIEGITTRQNRDTTSVKHGMFPGGIREDSTEYRIPEIAGLIAHAYREIECRMGVRDSVFHEKVVDAMETALISTAKLRARGGMILSGRYEHFLWDGPAAPDRSGATIETQVLYDNVVEFVDDYGRGGLPYSMYEIPSELLRRRATWTRVDKDGNYLDPSTLTITDPGFSDPPLPIVETMFFFQTHSGSGWADRLMMAEDGSEFSLSQAVRDTTGYVSIPLALTWYEYSSRSRKAKDFNLFFRDGFVTETGLRSLSEKEEDFQAEHIYQLDDAPYGTSSRGDVLLWTSKALTEMYFETQQEVRIGTLIEALSGRVLSSGVIGSLAEAETYSQADRKMYPVGNRAFAASLSNFIWVASRRFIGLEHSIGRTTHFMPMFPESWGNYRIDAACEGGTLSIERISDRTWLVSQSGIEPDLSFELNISKQIGESAKQFLSLKSGEIKKVTFFMRESGRWSSKVERL